MNSHPVEQARDASRLPFTNASLTEERAYDKVGRQTIGVLTVAPASSAVAVAGTTEKPFGEGVWEEAKLATRFTCCTLSLAVLLAGCAPAPPPPPPMPATAPNTASTVLLSVTSDAVEDPQAVDMAMKLAGFSLDEGRKVVMFFNVKGVTVPVNAFSDDFAFQENEPIKTQLLDLIQRGADVHVCPICMQALEIEESALIDGAKVTTRPNLFANIGPETAVFTY